MKQLVVASVAGAAFALAADASAQTVPPEQPVPSAQTVSAAGIAPDAASAAGHAATPAPAAAAPTDSDAPPLTQAQRDRALCARSFAVILPALEHDVRYARNWTDAWYVVGTSLITLNLSQIFMTDDYRQGEAIVFGSLSALLMIQKPTATWSADAVHGLHAAGAQDPCQALTTARYILESNEADYKDHTGLANHLIGIGINIAASAIVGAAGHHWEFFGHGDEGLTTLVGIAAGELQLLTYPRPSVKPGSLQLSAGASPFQFTF